MNEPDDELDLSELTGEQAPDEEVPSEDEFHQSIQPPAPSTARASLRILLFLSPGLSCAAMAFFSEEFGTGFLPTGTSISVLGFVLLILFLLSMAIFDGLISPTVTKNESRPVPGALLRHVFFFVAIQLVLAPLVVILSGMAFVTVLKSLP